jgi:hypothetical protein
MIISDHGIALIMPVGQCLRMANQLVLEYILAFQYRVNGGLC